MFKTIRPAKSTRRLATPRTPHAPEEGTRSEQGGVCWRPGGACGTQTSPIKNKVLSVEDVFNRRPSDEEAPHRRHLHLLKNKLPDGQQECEHQHHQRQR